MIWKALMLESGSGIAQDSTAAAALLYRAAHSEDTDYATLGKLHWATALYLGKGVERNEAEAMKWFKEAAAEGDPDAQAFLATGNHTADRDLEGRSVAGQLAARGPQGQKLEPVDTPPAVPATDTPAAPKSEIHQSWAYRGFDRFAVTLTRDDRPDDALVLILERRGMFDWKLAGVDLTPDPMG